MIVELSTIAKITAHSIQHELSREFLFFDQFEGETLCIEYNQDDFQENLLKLISLVDNKIENKNDKIIISTGVMNTGSKRFSECRSRQNIPLGNYAFVEVTHSAVGNGAEPAPKIFSPFISKTGFRGYCIAFPPIQGTTEDSHGILYFLRSGVATFRMLFPIKNASTTLQ